MKTNYSTRIKMSLPGFHNPRHACCKSNKSAQHIWNVAIILLFFFMSATAFCEEIPWSGKIFSHVSEEQPIESFLKDLFMSEGILANISSSIGETPVSGKFDKPAEEAFQQITSAFNLIWYYDGQVVYIYPANEIESETIRIKHTTAKVQRSLEEMGILDQKYPIRYFPKDRLIEVHGPKIYVDRISEALKNIDSYSKSFGSSVQNVRIFRLKHAWAADRQIQVGDRTINIPGVASILKGLTRQRDDRSINSFGSQTIDYRRGTSVVKAKEAGGSDAKSKKEPGNRPLSDVNYRLESLHTIQCAERLNAVIVNANPKNMIYYEKVIAELDVPLQLIEIKASIIDVDREALSSLGLDIEGTYKEGHNTYTGNTNVIPENNPLFNLVKIPSGTFGGLGFSAILGDVADEYLSFNLKALESKGRAKIISKPSIITFDNIEARFTNTETFYVRVAAREDASLYEISAGIVLKVTPHIIIEDQHPKIQLMIAIEDGKIKGDTLAVDQIPLVENSTINTQAVVGGNESLLIGGLIYDTRKDVVRKVPLLGDIPLLSLLFSSRDQINSQSERLFLISPRILNADGNANIIAQEGEADQNPYRNWPPVVLFETTF